MKIYIYVLSEVSIFMEDRVNIVLMHPASTLWLPILYDDIYDICDFSEDDSGTERCINDSGATER